MVMADFPAFFSFHGTKKGYSGVATWSRLGLVKEYKEFIPKDHLNEGRCAVSDHGLFVLVNVYMVGLLA